MEEEIEIHHEQLKSNEKLVDHVAEEEDPNSKKSKMSVKVKNLPLV